MNYESSGWKFSQFNLFFVMFHAVASLFNKHWKLTTITLYIDTRNISHAQYESKSKWATFKIEQFVSTKTADNLLVVVKIYAGLKID